MVQKKKSRNLVLLRQSYTSPICTVFVSEIEGLSITIEHSIDRPRTYISILAKSSSPRDCLSHVPHIDYIAWLFEVL